MKKLIAICAVAGLLLLVNSAFGLPTYWADSVYDSETGSYTGFNGGQDYNGDGIADIGDIEYVGTALPTYALGIPDASYVSILPDQYIIFEFSTPFINGIGDDLYIIETGDAGEEANISVSSDGTNWYSVGVATSGAQTVGSFGYYNAFDLGTISGPISYVMISDDILGATPGFDISGVGAVHPIPAPGAILLGGIGVTLVGWLRRRKIL